MWSRVAADAGCRAAPALRDRIPTITAPIDLRSSRQAESDLLCLLARRLAASVACGGGCCRASLGRGLCGAGRLLGRACICSLALLGGDAAAQRVQRWSAE